MSNHLSGLIGSPGPPTTYRLPDVGYRRGRRGAGVVLYRASPHPPRHFVVDVFLVLLVFLSVGLLYLRWEMFSKSMFFGCLPGFVVGVCFVSVTKT